MHKNKGKYTSSCCTFFHFILQCMCLQINDKYTDRLPKSVCDDCKINIDSFSNFLQKIRKVDNDLKGILIANNYKITATEIYKCEHCSAAVSDIHLFSEHLKTHRGKPFQCPECDKSYSGYASFQMHKRKHSSLFCFTCEIVFDDSIKKTQHVCDISSKSRSDIKNCEWDYKNKIFDQNSACIKSENSDVIQDRREENSHNDMENCEWDYKNKTSYQNSPCMKSENSAVIENCKKQKNIIDDNVICEETNQDMKTGMDNINVSPEDSK